MPDKCASPLISRLKRAVEFDGLGQLDEPSKEAMQGALFENIRLTPIIACLIECAELLPIRHAKCEDPFYSCPASDDAFEERKGPCNCGAMKRINALAKLEKLVGEG